MLNSTVAEEVEKISMIEVATKMMDGRDIIICLKNIGRIKFHKPLIYLMVSGRWCWKHSHKNIGYLSEAFFIFSQRSASKSINESQISHHNSFFFAHSHSSLFKSSSPRHWHQFSLVLFYFGRKKELLFLGNIISFLWDAA